MKRRLVCVSNRIALPRRSIAAGGLAIGVLGALRRMGGVWFGWNGELVDDEPGEAELVIRDDVAYASIALRRNEFERYYNGYANEALWPLFHYMPSKFRHRPEDRDAYESVNRTFAQRLAALLKPDDLVWIHDYHLIPLARRLREANVAGPIGFFLHIPFPHIEMLRVLPSYAELVRDLASYDLVGFQTPNDLASFHSALAHVFGGECSIEGASIRIGERTLRADVYPIGVDVDALQAQAVDAAASEPVRRFQLSLVGRKLMIGVDRLDYSKGLVERFASYERFLEAFPHNRGRVTYLQIAPLSRKDVQSYTEIRHALEQAAGRTNGRFADADWTPIRYLNRNVPHALLMGYYRAAHVGLVTPLRDGMNLVAKEYVAAQNPEDPGVLILSNLAGAARELTEALQINPYDPQAVGHAMERALTMSLAERRERHAALLATLRRNDVHAWAERFIRDLRATASTERGEQRLAG